MTKKLTISLLFVLFAFCATAQTVSTMYGDTGIGYQISNTPASEATFFLPYQALYDTNSSELWISDQGDNYMVLITGNTYFLRSGDYGGGFQDGGSIGTGGGLMYSPKGMAIGANDSLYIADFENHAIRVLSPYSGKGLSQTLSTVAGGGKKNGSLGQKGNKDGVGINALFDHPTGIGYAHDAKNGDFLVVADQTNNAIRKISLAKGSYGTVSTLATGLSVPEGIFIDALNNNDIYFTEIGNGFIGKISGGKVTAVVDSLYLNGPTSVVVRRNAKVNTNEMYIADGCRIMKFDMTKPTSATNPTTYAGDSLDTTCNFKDGAGNVALFNGIGAMSLFSDGSYLIVADQGNNRIRKVTLGTTSSYVEDITPKRNPFTAYPNPAYGHVFLSSSKSGNTEVSLLTITGKEVMTKSVDINAGQPYDIDLGGQPSGMYVLRVATNDMVYNQKIVVR